MEDKKRSRDPETEKAGKAANLPERNSNRRRSGEEGSLKDHLDTHEREGIPEDMRHMNAEQDEDQLRKDEEARRHHKSR